MPVRKLSIYATNFKSIGKARSGFDKISQINLIIGRNNSGKSTLIDLVQGAINGQITAGANRRMDKGEPTLVIETVVENDEVEHLFPLGLTNSAGKDLHAVGAEVIGGTFTRTAHPSGVNTTFQPLSTSKLSSSDIRLYAPSQFQAMTDAKERNPLFGKQFLRMTAERNVTPEPDSDSVGIHSNGQGITNVIQRFIHEVGMDKRALIEIEFLNGLNKIFNPDAVFSRITCSRNSGLWEIYLEEERKGLIALSDSGSGLKTIIHILSYIHLIPVLQNRHPSEFVMAFEEPENNLHPALQRRLIDYICESARKLNFSVFLSTHSTVAIDLLNLNTAASIVHITHNGTESTAHVVEAYVHHAGVLDDLDIRASDLLQANGIIWVEGPSDRIYVNHWISLWTNGEFQEGKDYQIVFYGGRLLAHLDATPLAQPLSGVAILRVNRNAAIIIDSDKRGKSDSINSTKLRIVEEITANGGIAWVTEGREIENYVSRHVFNKWNGTLAGVKGYLTKYVSVFDWLASNKEVIGSSYSGKKPLLAEQLRGHTVLADLQGNRDLEKNLEKLCSRVRQWNKFKEPAPLPLNS